ncbi:hypothetical protein DB346_11865 [Verrucomicrobia bacterium LW23]|nr:hypothetical protein DB346_11865 [Verrucomicrobia bacterium LW23]
MMKSKLLSLSVAALLATTFLTGCETIVITDGSGPPPSSPGGPDGPPRRPPLQAVVEPGAVRLVRGDRTMNVIRTARPIVERWRWVNGKSQIAIKSRGNHGPAVVELFDSRSGQQLDRVMAFAIQGGSPEWAMGFGD